MPIVHPSIARGGPIIETVASPDAPPSANRTLLSPSASSPDRNGAYQQDGDLYRCWQEAMRRNMEIPSGYLNVAVLLIRWKAEIDQLKCAPQV